MRRHEFHRCNDERCFVCDGGLQMCTICGQAEIELERECPGPRFGRVYVAGTRHAPSIADGSVVAALRAAGVDVVSRWHDSPPGDQNGSFAERRRVCAQNLADLDGARAVLAVPCETHHLRGAHFEMGYATGRGIPVFILGASGDFNTMTETPSVRYVASVAEAIETFGGRKVVV